MQLKEITREIQSNHIILPKNESEITGVNIDSRMVEPGDLFIAMRGTQVDGHKYIAAAEEKGAVAIVCESLPEQINPNVTYIKVAGCRRQDCNSFLRQPYRKAQTRRRNRHQRQNHHCYPALRTFPQHGT